MRVGGIAKGSGMIHPNMATMLSVITSDAAVDESLWTDIVRRGAINSFNQVSPAFALYTTFYVFYQFVPCDACSLVYLWLSSGVHVLLFVQILWRK